MTIAKLSRINPERARQIGFSLEDSRHVFSLIVHGVDIGVVSTLDSIQPTVDSINKADEEKYATLLDPSVSIGADKLYNKGVEDGIANCPATIMIDFMDKCPAAFCSLVHALANFPRPEGQKISDALFNVIEMMEASNVKN